MANKSDEARAADIAAKEIVRRGKQLHTEIETIFRKFKKPSLMAIRKYERVASKSKNQGEQRVGKLIDAHKKLMVIPDSLEYLELALHKELTAINQFMKSIRT